MRLPATNRLTLTSALLATFASQSYAQDKLDWTSIVPSEDIEWTPCYTNQTCARLSLPMDYKVPEGPKVQIALRMIPATDKANYKGTILINPGGPGDSGTEIIGSLGSEFSTVVGPSFDILGFDPRGVAHSTPAAKCFETQADFEMWTTPTNGRIMRLNDSSIAEQRAREQVMAAVCAKSYGGDGSKDPNGTAEQWGIGRYMDTASVAADMLQITQKMGQDSLQYWGFSYGTVLGQYFAAIYPDKIKRVVLDGVAAAEEFRTQNQTFMLANADDFRPAFYDFCFRGGPSKCAVYAPSVQEVKARVENILNSVEQAPLPVPFGVSGPAIITRDIVNNALFQSSWTPLVAFPPTAELLYALEVRNSTAWEAFVDNSLALSKKSECEINESARLVRLEANYAVNCGDAGPLNDGPDVFRKYLEESIKASSDGGASFATQRLRCEEWKITANNRYTGRLAADNTSHPILFVSNSFDPVCPLSSAKLARTKYPNSGLLEQKSYGHCSVSSPSVCTAKHIRAYFETGELPPEGTTCEVDELPFIGSVNVTSSRRSVEDEKRDNELRSALKRLSKSSGYKSGF